MATILTGTTRPSAAGDAISFAHDLSPNSWIEIPTALIAATEAIDQSAAARSGQKRVRITLKDAATPEGRIMEALVPMLETALLTLSRRIGPALQPRPATEASPACISCLEQCKLIVLTPDDPFAQIVCMLGCADCP